MNISILSLFPDYFSSPLSSSILGRAIDRGLLSVDLINLRDFSSKKGGRIDDRTYGGGSGMVLEPQAVVDAVCAHSHPETRTILLSPAGRPFTSRIAKELAMESHVLFLCGHYEGIDARALDLCIDETISVGDFVLTNGCIAALVIVDALSRFIDGVVGSESSVLEDSFEKSILDFPHYTRPRSYLGYSVPPLLLSGDHKKIADYRESAAIGETARVRPDLFLADIFDQLSDITFALIRYTDVPFSFLIDWYRYFGTSVRSVENGLLASLGGLWVNFITPAPTSFEEMSSQIVVCVTEEERSTCEDGLENISWPFVVSRLDTDQGMMMCLRVKDPSGLEWFVVSRCYGGDLW
ncbi:tRNA (guanosine(37)-N1)-methyltransferase TrmD [Candidatus Similichlamydia epinepheli]|uniref:tRNA (guanosine(37)-N1)-methyltransferase TrmD n=1 Tax=Candidatus Similichlamydia epinepheli TaxID=1903953 RepID=UPI000D379BFD|nr:tRNA (guanosine(37)-N1)-methyltransferase TrmD [Candidatus Similichlamydia epinepheli]